MYQSFLGGCSVTLFIELSMFLYLLSMRLSGQADGRANNGNKSTVCSNSSRHIPELQFAKQRMVQWAGTCTTHLPP